jgi:putative Mg2+ transporter-C (MgtC) family protein
MNGLDFAVRVAAGGLCGVLIGAERARDHQATGMRTLSLVGLGAALLLGAAGEDTGDQSRVIQGLITGVGFLGAGVILHGAGDERVHGLTTAAAVWVTTILGILAGVGRIWAALAGALVVVVLLLLGQHIDSAVARYLGGKDNSGPPH